MTVSVRVSPEVGIQTHAKKRLMPPPWAGCAVVMFIAFVFGGGTYQRSWPDAVVQVASLPLLIWAIPQVRLRWSNERVRGALLLAGAVVALPLMQLVPLPPVLWTLIPARDFVAAGFTEVLDGLPWFPISLSPAETWRSALSLLPPIAIFLSVIGLDRSARRTLTLLFIGFVFLSVVVGLAQAAQGPSGPFRFYGESTAAEGFFLNRNHFAAFLYAAVPFTAAWIVGLVADRRPHILVAAMLCLLVFASLLLGLGIARSRVGLMLAVLAALSSFALARTSRGGLPKVKARKYLFAGAFVGALLVFQFAALGLLQRLEADPLADARWTINSVTFPAAVDFLPFGSGFGTFDSIYMMYESSDLLTPSYVNNAHNDYAELLLEAGLPAAVVVALFFWCFLLNAFRAWRKPEGHVRAVDVALSRAATISIVLLVIHSAFDYPLRAAAISTLFAFACALILPAAPAASNEAPEGDTGGEAPRRRRRRASKVRSARYV
jgi:O-antigen ligase